MPFWKHNPHHRPLHTQEFVSALKGVPKDFELHISPLGWLLYDLIFCKGDGSVDFTSAGFAAQQALLGRHGDPLHRAVSVAYTTCQTTQVCPLSDTRGLHVRLDAIEELSTDDLYNLLINTAENEEAENEEAENQVNLWFQ